VGFKDWLDEARQQLLDREREEVRDRYKNNPVKLDRALRRIDARAKPGTTWFPPEPDPDITTMDETELEQLRDTLQIEIEEEERALENVKNYGESMRELFKDSPQSKHGSLVDAIAGAVSNSDIARRPLVAKKKLLSKVNVRLRNLLTPVALPPGPQIPQASKEQKKAADLQAALKEKDQVLASASPEMKPYIERLYREKIDKIMDS
jgi:hypothetical protein